MSAKRTRLSNNWTLWEGIGGQRLQKYIPKEESPSPDNFFSHKDLWRSQFNTLLEFQTYTHMDGITHLYAGDWQGSKILIFCDLSTSAHIPTGCFTREMVPFSTDQNFIRRSQTRSDLCDENCKPLLLETFVEKILYASSEKFQTKFYFESPFTQQKNLSPTQGEFTELANFLNQRIPKNSLYPKKLDQKVWFSHPLWDVISLNNLYDEESKQRIDDPLTELVHSLSLLHEQLKKFLTKNPSSTDAKTFLTENTFFADFEQNEIWKILLPSSQQRIFHLLSSMKNPQRQEIKEDLKQFSHRYERALYKYQEIQYQAYHQLLGVNNNLANSIKHFINMMLPHDLQSVLQDVFLVLAQFIKSPSYNLEELAEFLPIVIDYIQRYTLILFQSVGLYMIFLDLPLYHLTCLFVTPSFAQLFATFINTRSTTSSVKLVSETPQLCTPLVVKPPLRDVSILLPLPMIDIRLHSVRSGSP